MLSMTMTFAENENTKSQNTVAAYDMTVNMRRLGQVLELSKDQIEPFTEIHKTFCNEMLFAAQYGKEERDQLVDKAVKKHVAYMGYILDKEQYRRYVMLLNVTLTNRGLK